jgi:hypothetical protein
MRLTGYVEEMAQATEVAHRRDLEEAFSGSAREALISGATLAERVGELQRQIETGGQVRLAISRLCSCLAGLYLVGDPDPQEELPLEDEGQSARKMRRRV